MLQYDGGTVKAMHIFVLMLQGLSCQPLQVIDYNRQTALLKQAVPAPGRIRQTEVWDLEGL